MDLPTDIATAKSPVMPTRQVGEGLQPIGAGPVTILGVAVWIGLIAGFLDLGLMVVKTRWIDGDFYRVGGDFVWIIPAAVAVLVFLPATVLALVARLRHGGLRPGVAVGLLSFVGFIDLCARLPLELWAAFLLSGGLAIQSGRLVGPRRRAFLELVRRTTSLLVGILVASALGTIGVRAWTEYRAAASLPPPPPGAKNLLLIVWDTVLRWQSQPPRLRTPDDAPPRGAGQPRVPVRPRVRDGSLDPSVARQPVHRAMAPRAGGRLEVAPQRRRAHARRVPRRPRL